MPYRDGWDDGVPELWVSTSPGLKLCFYLLLTLWVFSLLVPWFPPETSKSVVTVFEAVIVRHMRLAQMTS